MSMAALIYIRQAVNFWDDFSDISLDLKWCSTCYQPGKPGGKGSKAAAALIYIARSTLKLFTFILMMINSVRSFSCNHITLLVRQATTTHF